MKQMKQLIAMTLIFVGILLSGCNSGKIENFRAKYTIIKDGKIIGYSERRGSYDSGCKEVYTAQGDFSGKICGDYFIKNGVKMEFDNGSVK